MKKRSKDNIKSNEQTIDKHIEQFLFDVKRGFLQFFVLALINQRPTYAYAIKTEISRITDGLFDIDRNNLYKKLRSLEKDGILKSTEKASSRGANRKYYSLTPFGKSFLKEMSKLMVPAIDSLLKIPEGYAFAGKLRMRKT